VGDGVDRDMYKSFQSMGNVICVFSQHFSRAVRKYSVMKMMHKLSSAPGIKSQVSETLLLELG
jgi:hypothetical protein